MACLNPAKKTCLQHFIACTADENELEEKIKTFLKSNGIKLKEVFLIINSTDTIMKFISLPKLSPKELDKIIHNSMLDTVPVNPEIYQIDYKIINVQDGTVQLMFVAVLKRLIHTYYKILITLNLKPLCFDIYENCLAEYFGHINKSKTLLVYEYLCKDNFIFLENGFIKSFRCMDSHDQNKPQELTKLFGYYTDFTHVDKVYILSDHVDWVNPYFDSMDNDPIDFSLQNNAELGLWGASLRYKGAKYEKFKFFTKGLLGEKRT